MSILPPTALDVALEQLRLAKAKRVESTHIIIIPCLFTTLYCHLLDKEATLVLHIPIGLLFQPYNIFKLIILIFLFPYTRFSLWRIRRIQKLFIVVRELEEVQKDKSLDRGNILHKFLLEMAKLHSLSECMVRKLLYFNQQLDFPHKKLSTKRN